MGSTVTNSDPTEPAENSVLDVNRRACVLAAVDWAEAHEDIVARAAELARVFACQLVLLHVAAPDPEFVGYDVGPQSVRDAVAAELRAEHRRLDKQVRDLTEQGLNVRGLMVQGVAADKILDHAQRLDARMIVMGCHGHGRLYDLIVGSVAETVLRRAQRPVLLVPSRAAG